MHSVTFTPAARAQLSLLQLLFLLLEQAVHLWCTVAAASVSRAATGKLCSSVR